MMDKAWAIPLAAMIVSVATLLFTVLTYRRKDRHEYILELEGAGDRKDEKIDALESKLAARDAQIDAMVRERQSLQEVLTSQARALNRLQGEDR